MPKDKDVLVRAVDLKLHFNLTRGFFARSKVLLKAVDGVSFSIRRGRTIGLVGESGCGKTTVGRTLVRLYRPTSGSILFDGTDLSGLSEKALAPYRPRMQMIFQDPYSALNPRMTVGDIISEPLRIQRKYETPQQVKEAVRGLIDKIGLKPDHINRYPHEFSGGQRQRIVIARALANMPEFIVCDEPVSALDVSIQAQVINLLEELQETLGLTYLFVSHDLSVVRHISHDVGVMYLGHLVETAPVRDLYADTLHPYTQSLLSAIPRPDPDSAAQSSRILLKGDVPTPINPPPGCPFSTRCPHAFARCRSERPLLKERRTGHFAACHLLD